MNIDQLHLSKEMMAKIKELPETKHINVFGYQIPVHESPLFPFEIHYDACDVETRQPVKIGSGEFIHGVMIPQVNLEEQPRSFEFSFDQDKNEFKGFAAKNWGIEIFKF